MSLRTGMTRGTRRRGRRNIWAVCYNRRFSVREERSRRPLIPPVTQRLAITIARLIARESRSELIVQGRRGRIRFRDSHGHDTFPPRG